MAVPVGSCFRSQATIQLTQKRCKLLATLELVISFTSLAWQFPLQTTCLMFNLELRTSCYVSKGPLGGVGYLTWHYNQGQNQGPGDHSKIFLALEATEVATTSVDVFTKSMKAVIESLQHRVGDTAKAPSTSVGIHASSPVGGRNKPNILVAWCRKHRWK